MVGEIPPVRGVEQHEVGVVAGSEAPEPLGTTEDVRRVDRAGGKGLRRRQLELRRRQRAHERQAFAECAARIEVGRERDHRAGFDERPRRRHRPGEEERARREQHRRDIACSQRSDSLGARRLEVVDRPRAELDRERDGALLGELVGMQTERKARSRAGLEIAARLRGVERATLEEDVGGLRELGGLREDLVRMKSR